MHKHKLLVVFIIAAATILGAAGAQADTLLINSVYQKPELERPGRGHSMDKVRATFGEPAQVYDAVGEPPITRWQYPDFVVYFEYDKVLHSVLKTAE